MGGKRTFGSAGIYQHMQGKDFTYDITGGIMMTQKERRVAVEPKKNQPIF